MAIACTVSKNSSICLQLLDEVKKWIGAFAGAKRYDMCEHEEEKYKYRVKERWRTRHGERDEGR